jgi:hypothetical protein
VPIVHVRDADLPADEAHHSHYLMAHETLLGLALGQASTAGEDHTGEDAGEEAAGDAETAFPHLEHVEPAALETVVVGDVRTHCRVSRRAVSAGLSTLPVARQRPG